MLWAEAVSKLRFPEFAKNGFLGVTRAEAPHRNETSQARVPENIVPEPAMFDRVLTQPRPLAPSAKHRLWLVKSPTSP